MQPLQNHICRSARMTATSSLVSGDGEESERHHIPQMQDRCRLPGGRRKPSAERCSRRIGFGFTSAAPSQLPFGATDSAIFTRLAYRMARLPVDPAGFSSSRSFWEREYNPTLPRPATRNSTKTSAAVSHFCRSLQMWEWVP